MSAEVAVGVVGTDGSVFMLDISEEFVLLVPPPPDCLLSSPEPELLFFSTLNYKSTLQRVHRLSGGELKYK